MLWRKAAARMCMLQAAWPRVQLRTTLITGGLKQREGLVGAVGAPKSRR